MKKLSFDSTCNQYTHWIKQKLMHHPHEESSGFGVFHSHNNSYAILGDLFQDMTKTLSVNENEISLIKGKNKV